MLLIKEYLFLTSILYKVKKNLDLLAFKQVAGIIKSKDHLTSEGIKEILDIKAKMNE